MMMYPVQTLDYDGLVKEMAQENSMGMAMILSDALGTLPKPKLAAERDYFWKALHNASRRNLKVWLWLITQLPHLDTAKGLHTDPYFNADWPLPEIRPDGELIDKKAEAKAIPPQYPADPTEENFRGQVYVLEQYFRDHADPESVCHNVTEYVATFYYRGTAKMHAKQQLAAYGLNALATQEGIEWLMRNYPPSSTSPKDNGA
jgi:hypothetical protein